MNDIIKALERIAEKLKRAGARVPVETKGTIESAMAAGLSMALVLIEEEQAALATYRASVDAVELPEPDGVIVVGTQALRALSSTTVRRLIAEAVAREQEECAEVCEGKVFAPDAPYDEASRAALECVAAIRSRGGAGHVLPREDGGKKKC